MKIPTPFPIDSDYIQQFIEEALFEDVRNGDITALACIPSNLKNKAVLKIKDSGILAGIDFARRVFFYLDADTIFTPFKKDGDIAIEGDIAFEVICNTQALLKAERLVLNAMQRMSGIATLSNIFKSAVSDLNVTILDTRKTTPMFRYFEKWAVAIGGCANYRFGLYDWFMIKDNHADASGGLANAIERVTQYKLAHPETKNLGLTVEVRNLEELETALAMPKGVVTRVMLDNFALPQMKKAVKRVNKQIQTEISGGVNIKNLRRFALTGVDYISSGALTHSARSLDLSLKIVK